MIHIVQNLYDSASSQLNLKVAEKTFVLIGHKLVCCLGGLV